MKFLATLVLGASSLTAFAQQAPTSQVPADAKIVSLDEIDQLRLENKVKDLRLYSVQLNAAQQEARKLQSELMQLVNADKAKYKAEFDENTGQFYTVPTSSKVAKPAEPAKK